MASLERAAARAAELVKPLHEAEKHLGIVVLVVDTSADASHGFPIVATANVDDVGKLGIVEEYARRLRRLGFVPSVSVATAKRGGAR